MSATTPAIPGLATAQQSERAESLLVTAYRSGITDAKELANFMGQTQHESQNFSRLEENLNYRGSVLWQTFKGDAEVPPRNGLTENEANALAAIGDRQQRNQAIADKIYGGEWGGRRLGNVEPGDGYLYRGRGYIQLTGRGNYAEYQQKTGLDLVNQPELAANPGNAETLAIQYWKDNVQTKGNARASVTDAGSIINTGQIGNAVKGLADRQAKAAAWEEAIGNGYLQEALARHPLPNEQATRSPAPPEQTPLRLQPSLSLSPQSLQLIQDSEHHVRNLAERYHLPWDPGMDNTVFALAQRAQAQGLTGITHLKVEQGLIHFAQFNGNGSPLKEGQMGALDAANTPAYASVTSMTGAEPRPLTTPETQLLAPGFVLHH
ncbi:glycoside hydrolase family 19 protein [Hydrogenophaga electricum]|uniref:Glycoside hydrolase family 19 catalytic domain-containing protein n=1 Tax=Hydrogenophaga electricum TaxID=1230953 RepID=A0ABQ6C495_9BURK|nr:hypothetical protein [Hydrogenophaga electricum]GLS13161.1 hypothetical protein GCM10007935_05900 [Hydrogenophaga electricum]